MAKDVYAHGSRDETRRLPTWLKRPIPSGGSTAKVESVLDTLRLETVCQSALCPNRGECFNSGTSTFLIMGDTCTRACKFCAVPTSRPLPLDPSEPKRLAQATKELELSHVVITSVTRDDLADGGAAHFAACIRAIKEMDASIAVEVLTSDFAGDRESVRVVIEACPDVFNHNVETVPRLYAEVRPQAIYQRSLDVLSCAREANARIVTKSGLMVGLGETQREVQQVMDDLLDSGVSILTLGQYLRPSPEHLPVAEFIEPEQFARYERIAYQKGFAAVASAPLVRSSYHASELSAQEKIHGSVSGDGKQV